MSLRDGFDPFLSIREGNEDLEPAETDSYDLSFEYYTENAGVFKAAVFYKDIKNLTEDNATESNSSLDGVELPPFEEASSFPAGLDLIAEAAAGNVTVSRRSPFNNPDNASIWGVELAAEQQFTWLPGVWSGFGAYANYTYTESDRTAIFTFNDPALGETVTVNVDGVSFNGDPEHYGNVAATYNKYGIDSALIYSFQDRRQTGFRANGLSEFTEAFDTLDFRFAYTPDDWGGNYQFVFEAVDLLRGADEASVINGEGESRSYYTNRSFLGGREFRLGLTATF